MIPALSRPVWAHIDLDIIENNAKILTSLAYPSQLCAVVKANAYGHGAVEVSKAAIKGGASWLGVATLEEAIQLREAKIQAPILLLSQPHPNMIAKVAQYGFSFMVYTELGLQAAKEISKSYRPKMHLKIDTGMHRVGASSQEGLILAHLIAQDPKLTLEGVCSHFACADDDQDSFTTYQLDQFNRFLSLLEQYDIDPGIVHLANSAALLRYPQTHFDLVRVGIALYGYPPVPFGSQILKQGLKPALSLKALLSLLRKVPAGEGVSYGLRYKKPHECTYGVAPIGYADGILRRLSLNGAQVLLNSQRRPFAGTVTMDQILIDCGDIENVKIGDEVVFIGTQGKESISALDLATHLETITYEILTSLSDRIPRFYSDKECNEWLLQFD